MKNNENFLMIVIVASFFLCGCQQVAKYEEENINMEQEELFDIYYLFEAPKAKKDYNLTEIIKVVFTKNDSSLTDTVAIDIQNNEIYIDPRVSSLGIRARNGTLQISDADKVLKILEKYDVQSWKNDYSFENPDTYEDGFGWNLIIQFEDGAIKEYRGSGSEEEITPSNFKAFVAELTNFADDRLNNE